MIDEYIRNWLQKADSDLRMIEHEMALPDTEWVTDGICFHCQQAVKKAQKAYLIYHGIETIKTFLGRMSFLGPRPIVQVSPA
jgi:HEPN domain-containing protein